MTDVLVEELLVGGSEPMRRLRNLIVRIAPTTLPVLIEGETGTGKDMVARALHMASGRRGQFVPFNVCAIADTMFEDTLFGHVRGSFTGAVSDSPGYLKQAHEGTVFFDEISGLGIGSQVKLLRAIETGEFRPVGASKDVKIDLRVIAATNQDLHRLESSGAFRSDLLHRFGKMILHVPPLRDRIEDIPALARHFLERFARNAPPIADGTMVALADYDWPGNVRELKAVVEAASVLCSNGHISVDVVRQLTAPAREPRPQPDPELARTLEAMDRARGDAEAAALDLGVHRSTVYRRLNRAADDGWIAAR